MGKLVQLNQISQENCALLPGLLHEVENDEDEERSGDDGKRYDKDLILDIEGVWEVSE